MTSTNSDPIEKAAIALSLADPDSRQLPPGEEMAPFYRKLARACISSLTPPSEEVVEAMTAAWYAEPNVFGPLDQALRNCFTAAINHFLAQGEKP